MDVGGEGVVALLTRPDEREQYGHDVKHVAPGCEKALIKDRASVSGVVRLRL